MTLSPLTLFTALMLGWAAFLGWLGPKPKVNDLSGRWYWAPDSTVAYDARTYLSGPLAPRDVIRYTTYKDNVLVGDVRTTRTDTTFSFAARTLLLTLGARLFKAP